MMKKKIKKICDELLEHLFIFDAKVGLRETEGLYEIRFDCQEPGILIGKNGETMRALELILRLLVSKKIGEPMNLLLDIAGYKEKRKQEIEEMGMRAAESARHSGRAQLLAPMNAYERRVAHLILADQDDIETESIGEEPNRRVMIRVKKKELI